MDAMTHETAPLVPLVFNTFESKRVRFSAACFQGPGNELSLGPLKEPEDARKHPLLTARLRSAMRHLGANRAYAPYPVNFNGVIIKPVELSKVFLLEPGMLMFRNNNMPADGTFLRQRGDAGIFSASGCSVIVAVLGDYVIFAHAGRDCVINRKRVLGEPDARPFESVVDNIVKAFLEFEGSEPVLSNIRAWVLYSIKPENFVHRFDDEKHHVYNRLVVPHLETLGLVGGMQKSVEDVWLDIPTIAKLQFMQHGVPEQNISLEHAYLSDELPTTRNGGGRYLVAVVRH